MAIFLSFYLLNYLSTYLPSHSLSRTSFPALPHLHYRPLSHFMSLIIHCFHPLSYPLASSSTLPPNHYLKTSTFPLSHSISLKLFLFLPLFLFHLSTRPLFSFPSHPSHHYLPLPSLHLPTLFLPTISFPSFFPPLTYFSTHSPFLLFMMFLLYLSVNHPPASSKWG